MLIAILTAPESIAEHPDWKWIIMRRGKEKMLNMQIYSTYRNPDAFGGYSRKTRFLRIA